MSLSRGSIAAVRRARVAVLQPVPIGLGAIGLLGLLLRLYRLGAPSLNADEGLSAVFYSQPLEQLFATLVREDLHPPLYPLLLDGWMRLFGDSEVALRLPSAIFGALLVPATYLAARVFWRDDRDSALVGLVAAALTAVSPVQLYYSQIARNYILVTLAGLLSGVALFAALQHGRRRDWLLYALATALALYSHYNAFLVVPAQVLVVLLFALPLRRRLIGFALGLIGALALFAPWATYMVRQLLRISDYVLIPYSVADMGRAVVIELITGAAGGRLGVLLLPLVALALALVVLGAVSVVRAAGTDHRAATVYLFLAVVVPVGALLALWSVLPKYGPRYLLIVAPALTLLVARGLVLLLRLRTERGALQPLAAAGRALGVGLTVVALAGSAVAVRDSFAAEPSQDYREIVATISADVRPTDGIAMMPYAYQPVLYYFRTGRFPVPPYTLHYGEDFHNADARIRDLARQHERLWLIWYFPEWTDPAGFTAHALDERAIEPPVTREFGTVNLTLYRFDPAKRDWRDPVIEQPASLRFENGAVFKGWSLVRAPARPGTPTSLDLHWQLERPVAADFKVVVTVEDSAEHVLARLDQTPVLPLYAPKRWRVGDVLHGPIRLELPPATPPGRYRLRLFIYDETTQREIGALGADGGVVGTRVPIGEMTVDRPLEPASPDAVALDRRLDPAPTFSSPTGGALRLLGDNLPRAEVLEGDTVDLGLLWQAGAAPGRDYTAVVQGLAEGRTVLEAPLPPVAELPTSQWRAGDLLLGQHRLKLPTEVPGGKLQLRVGLRDGAEWLTPSTAGVGSFVAIGELSVKQRAVARDVPPMQHTVGQELGGMVRLLGYDVDATATRPGGALRLTLYWQAVGPIDRNYKVFNHVVGGDGRPVAQRDAEPQDGAVKMIAWKPGEVVKDTHVIPVPADAGAGDYSLVVGLYDAESGKRLAVSGGGDSVPLQAVRIGS